MWSSIVLWCLYTFSCSSLNESSEYSGLATTYCLAPARIILLLLPGGPLLPLYVTLRYNNHIKLEEKTSATFERHFSKLLTASNKSSRSSDSDRTQKPGDALYCPDWGI
ncbi:hypothetical protein GOODEAATRI_032047 [Goodea atripinnis]|uniref:Uncharacterized protein n=1 Tax=Goodea atripinnis TaxID=208336 RepID=A0ABV0NQ62_9TELE